MEAKLSKLYRQLNVSHRVVVQKYLDQYGLYIGQPRFLFVLEEQEGISQAILSSILKVTKETVSVTLKRLEQSGYIRREVSQSDKRIKLLYLNEKGKELMPELRKNFNDINERMFSQLDKNEKEILESLYEKMLQGLGEEL
ncbi:MAG TPA: MarR family transcriptional regulator [Erysipelothrix sp.]|nr:MarR family transcriptional regulator [Erysipelothrix sp.]